MGDRARNHVVASLRKVSQDHVRAMTPINLSLSIPGMGEVSCNDVLRAIRGKRLVCLGRLGETGVVVKLYFARRKARRHWRRSDRGCRAFIERGIPAPGILFSGYLPGHDLYAMILEYLEGGSRVDRVLEAMTDERERSGVLCLLVRELARHHAAGIVQNDLHLGNFMLRDRIVYSLDGDQVERCGDAVERKRSLANLARLLANVTAARDADLAPCIENYMHERKWSYSRFDVDDVKAMAYRIRRKDLLRYLGKALRSRDPFVARTETDLFAVLDRRHAGICLSDILVASEEKGLARVATCRGGYRERTSGDVALMELCSPGIGPLAFRRVFGAVRTWKNALTLKRIGLGTPEPVALVLKRRWPLVWQCSVFSRPVKEGVGLRDHLVSPGISRRDKDRTLMVLKDALARMGGVGISPGRLKPDHVLVSGEEVFFMNPGALRRPSVCSAARCERAAKRFLSDCEALCASAGIPGSGMA